MTSPGLAGASYVDTTALSAVVFGEEPVAESITRKLSGFRYLLSANLLEAEMRVAFVVEGREFHDEIIENCGHHPELEATDRFVNLIEEFLGRG